MFELNTALFNHEGLIKSVCRVYIAYTYTRIYTPAYTQIHVTHPCMGIDSYFVRFLAFLDFTKVFVELFGTLTARYRRKAHEQVQV